MITIGLYLLYLLINLTYAFEPSCTSCKFFIPHETNPRPDLGLCTMFQDNNNGVLIKKLAINCRNNEILCGKSGLLYEKSDNQSDTNKQNDIFERYEHSENMCYGEFTDKKDLEELEEIEKEILEMFQKMRRYNTKTVYRTSKDIYKLFKKNKKQ
jgi:hypothetical protein